jgi:hypothetical protein
MFTGCPEGPEFPVFGGSAAAMPQSAGRADAGAVPSCNDNFADLGELQ